MKILMVTHFFPRFGETFILEQANAFVEMGHDLAMLVLIGADQEAYDQRSLQNGLPDLVIDGSAYGKPVFQRLGSTIRGTIKSLFRHPRALFFARHGKRAFRGQLAAAVDVIGELGEFDVIFAAFGPAGVSAEALRDIGLVRGPIVTSFLGYDITREILLNGSRNYRRLFSHCELFNPNSGHLRMLMLKHGAPEERTVLHHLGVDVDHFRYVDRSSNKGTPLIAAVGRLVEKKGFSDLMDAAGRLRDDGVAFRLEFAGDGPLADSLKEQAVRLGLENHVQFLGWCDADAVGALLARADLLAAPSVVAEDGDAEGLPLTLIEAASTGLPLVGTDHSGIPEIVIDGVTGHVIPERDVEALSRALGALCEDQERRLEMGLSGRRLVESEFNASIQAERLLDALAEMASNYRA